MLQNSIKLIFCSEYPTQVMAVLSLTYHEGCSLLFRFFYFPISESELSLNREKKILNVAIYAMKIKSKMSFWMDKRNCKFIIRKVIANVNLSSNWNSQNTRTWFDTAIKFRAVPYSNTSNFAILGKRKFSITLQSSYHRSIKRLDFARSTSY